ncbi:MAG: site-2 protease family protein [Actinomycetota bacterium]|nr:site-2 protease family protein [Actinomycetota bacterium]
MLLGILVFVGGIFAMILVHEAGHYFAAKRYGIKVDEFFLGFGPRIWSFRRGETEYGLKAIPLGGYVRIAGMNPFEEVPPEDRERVFTSKPKRQRAVVLVAGGLTHFVLAFVLVLSYSWFIGLPVFGGAQVAAVEPRLDGEPSPAAVAGLQPGDRFVAFDGRPVDDYQAFLDYIDSHVGQEIELVVERDGERVTTRAAPVLSRVGDELSGRLGISVSEAIVARDRAGPVEGVVQAGRAMYRLGVGSFQAMARVFSPEGIGRVGEAILGQRDREADDPVGIVGAARVSGQAFQAGQVDALFALFAFFNVFVGILNLLPLPPLDGGHLAVLGIEAVTGKRVDPRKLIPITAVVAGFLILFTVSLLYLDVVQPIPNPFR